VEIVISSELSSELSSLDSEEIHRAKRDREIIRPICEVIHIATFHQHDY
jgi:hypothetical protein